MNDLQPIDEAQRRYELALNAYTVLITPEAQSSQCYMCSGRGYKRFIDYYSTHEVTCPLCHGAGIVAKIQHLAE